MEGTVKWFNRVKNFGFITPSDGSKDVFVHSTGIKEGESITENDKVTFEVKEGERGPQAINVTKGGAGKASDESKESEEKPAKKKASKKKEE